MADTTIEEGGETSASSNLAGKYLTFHLNNEEYGLEIMKVQEIIGMMPITQVPRVPDYVRGVINLRGKIIPTIELRSKFSLQKVEDTERTCIIVVEVDTPKGSINMGIIVDEVAEVLDIRSDEIDKAPDFGSNLDTEFMLGVGVVKGSVKILLDVDKVLTAEEVITMDSSTQN